MIDLNRVTLVAVDGPNWGRILPAVHHCKRLAQFAEVVYFSAFEPPPEEMQGIRYVYSNTTSLEGYCNCFIKEIPHAVNSEFIMMIHHDGFIMNPEAWTDEFLNYDYIGAPWPVDLLRNCGYPQFNEPLVGNDGFSIRSTKLARRASEFPGNFIPTDNFVAIWHRQDLENEGFKFAPVDIAMRFSVESHPYTGSFGCHGLHFLPLLREKIEQYKHV